MGKKSRRNFVKDALDGSRNPGRAVANLVTKQVAEDMPSPDMAAFLKPDSVNESSIQATKLLPRSDEVWFADYLVITTDEGCETNIPIFMVEKEHKSNGAILPKSDGLSFPMGICYVSKPTSDVSIMKEIPSWLVGTIIKACREPCVTTSKTMTVPPHRPRKILFRSAGIMNAVACHVEEMGIREVGVAEAGLVESVQSILAPLQERNCTSAGLVNKNWLDSRNAPRRIAAARRTITEYKNPYCEENERHSPLANWTEDAKSMIGAAPLEWFVKPPPTNGAIYRNNQLWGWRSNLEMACKIGDDAKIAQLGTTYPEDHVRSFCEQRLLLTNAAQHGMLTVCKALLKHCHCHPDGVQSSTNKVEWEPFQSESGSQNSLTPLHSAAREGHKKIVQLLIKHGANVNLTDNGGLKATALHYAAFCGHQNICQLLCKAGADRSIQHRDGHTPIMTARSVLLSGDPSKRRHIAAVIEIGKYDVQEQICGACGTGGALRKCPCGFQVYCDKECQISMWRKIHRTEHHLHLSGGL